MSDLFSHADTNGCATAASYAALDFKICRHALSAIILTTFFMLHGTTNTHADDVKIGDIGIEQAWSRATPKGAPIGAGYVKLTNTGTKPDRLISAASAIAARVEIHQMKMDGGIMRMRRVADGLELPPGQTVALKPGGYHLMFIKLGSALVKGTSFMATLRFEVAGTATVPFRVEAIGAAGPSSSQARVNGGG